MLQLIIKAISTSSENTPIKNKKTGAKSAARKRRDLDHDDLRSTHPYAIPSLNPSYGNPNYQDESYGSSGAMAMLPNEEDSVNSAADQFNPSLLQRSQSDGSQCFPNFNRSSNLNNLQHMFRSKDKPLEGNFKDFVQSRSGLDYPQGMHAPKPLPSAKLHPYRRTLKYTPIEETITSTSLDYSRGQSQSSHPAESFDANLGKYSHS